MTAQYQTTLFSQMGPRQGTLTLEYDGGTVTGFLELVGYRNPVRGTRAEDGRVHLSHVIQTAVSTILCQTVLAFSQGRLTGETSARPCRIRWEGAEIPRGSSDRKERTL